MSMTPESVKDFARRVRERTGAYTDVDDHELVRRVVAKHPDYSSAVNTDELNGWRGLKSFAEGSGFKVTSTTGGGHNPGSKHYAGRAVDVRTRDKSPEEIQAFIEAAPQFGLKVRDERTRPPGQRKWGGPHLHLEGGEFPPLSRPATAPSLEPPATPIQTGGALPTVAPPPPIANVAEPMQDIDPPADYQSPIAAPARRTEPPARRQIRPLARPQRQSARFPTPEEMNAELQAITRQAELGGPRVRDVAPQNPRVLRRRVAGQQTQVDLTRPPLRPAVSPRMLESPLDDLSKVRARPDLAPRTTPQTLMDIDAAARSGAVAPLTSLAKSAGVVQGAITGQDADSTGIYRLAEGAEQVAEKMYGGQRTGGTLTDALPSAAGQLSTQVGLAMIPKVGKALTGATAIAQQAVEGYEDARRQGADESTARRAAVLNAPLGALDALLPGGVAGSVLKGGARRGATAVGKELLKGAAIEGGTEGVQQAGANVIANTALGYDPTRRTLEGVPQAAGIGAIVGGGANVGPVATSTASRRASVAPVVEPVAPQTQDVEIPVSRISAPRVVRSTPANSAAPVTRVRHSNPQIDGDQVVGRTADGKLKVQGDDGVTHTVKDPRKQGNREAALVREAVSEDISSEQGTVDAGDAGQRQVAEVGQAQVRPIPEEAAQTAGAAPRLAARIPELAPPARPSEDFRAVGAADVATGSAEAIARRSGLEMPPLRRPRVAAPVESTPVKVPAPVPDREALKTQLGKAFKLSADQSEGVAQLVEARANAWSRETGRPASEYIPARFAGVVEGGEAEGGALYQSGDEPTFYSQARRTVESKMPNRASVEQVRALVTNPQSGVKADEIKWTGLDDFLREKAVRGESVSKQEALEFLRQNEVRVEEVVKDSEGENNKRRYQQAKEALNSYPLARVAMEAGMSQLDAMNLPFKVRDGRVKPEDLPADLQQPAREFLALWREFDEAKAAADESAGPPKFSQYTLPGAKEGSYRELLLTLPTPEETYILQGGEGGTVNILDTQNDRIVKSGLSRAEADAELARLESRKQTYKSSHYDEPNILAHVRFNERTDAEGKRVLFVEEVQSDWHQAGRKKGYKGSDEKALTGVERARLEQELEEQQRVNTRYWRTDRERADAAARRAIEIRRLLDDPAADAKVPDAPFSKNWHELAMKRVLRHAAENGYDRVAWTTGEQQAERYDLSKQVDAIDYVPRANGNFDISVVGETSEVLRKQDVSASELEDIVGKEIAERMVQGVGKDRSATFAGFADGRKVKSLSGIDLKVGGEGMKGFYDRILPSFMQKYGRKWGGVVAQTEIPVTRADLESEGIRRDGAGNYYFIQHEGGVDRRRTFETRREAQAALAAVSKTKAERVHSIDITPEMRRSVMQEGQPLFQGEKAATEFLADSRAILRGFAKADVSSAVHEFAHVFRRDLPPDLLSAAEKDLGVKDGNWTTKAEEDFARGFERYLKTGEAPSVSLRKVFESFKTWLTEIYGAIRGKDHPLKVKVSPELTAVFDRALGGEPKGEFGKNTSNLYNSGFFAHPAVRQSLGLKPVPAEAPAADLSRAMTETSDALTRAVGGVRASRVSPETIKRWARENSLPADAMELLDGPGGAAPAEVPPLKAPTEYQRTGVRKVKLDTQTMSLSQAVRASGGIRVDRDSANAGEVARLSNKESGSSGIVSRGGGNVEDVAQAMREYGYPASTDPNEFLQQIEADLRGEKIYSSEREIDYEEEYRKEHPEEEQDALISLLESERGGILFDKVESGRATKQEVEEFSNVARDEFGLYPDQITAIVREGRRKKKEGVPDSLRGAAADDFDFRPDQLEENPSVLYQRDNPRQLNLQTSDLELLTQAGHSPPRDATREQIKSAADSLRQDRLREKLGDNFTPLAGLTEEGNDPQVRRLALDIYKRIEAGAEVPETLPDTVAALRKFAELRRTKTPVKDFLNQGSLFGERELTPQQERILLALDSNPRKVLDEAVPERPRPTQDMLFQSAATDSRRQRAYKALYNAKQPALSPELEAPKSKPTLRDRVADVANVPRSLKSSVDLSASMRQGAMFTLTHPARSARIFFGRQLRSLSNRGFEDFQQTLRSDPDAKLMRESGLHLTSIAEDTISEREEAFASKLVGKIPVLGGRIGLTTRSEQAYTTFLDSARSEWFKQLARQAESAAKESGRPVTLDDYKVIAKFVNRATGRGDLGKGKLNDAAPLLNSVFFAPRYVASRVQVFDPRMYAQLPPGARRMAIRQAVQYFATVGAVAALFKYGFEEEVGTDPESSDFGKLKIGNTRYDLTAGQGQYFVLAARLYRNFVNRQTGTKDDFGKDALSNLKRFARYKLAPLPAAALNVAEGRNAIGQPTGLGKESIDLVSPIFLKDLYEAYAEEGWSGVGKNAPGFVGVGVNTYGERESKVRPLSRPRRPERPKRPER